MKIWVVGRGGMSSGRDIICRACQEETQNWKGKIKGQKLKYFLWQWLCLEFFTVCAVTLLPTASFKWCEKLWSWSVFLKETDCSNNAQLKTFYFVVFQQNITHFIFTYVFSAWDLQRILTFIIITTIQQKAAVLFYQQDNRGMKMLYKQVVVTEDNCRMRRGIQEAWLTEPWKDRTSSLLLCVFSPNQSHPSGLSADTRMPAPVQAQLDLDTHLRASTATCWELPQDEWVTQTAPLSPAARRGTASPLTSQQLGPAPKRRSGWTHGPSNPGEAISCTAPY